MKDASSSYYSRDRESSYSESTRTPYIQEDDSMMTYYTDESVERRQNKKLTYDTFIPMESDSSPGSTTGSGHGRGWRKEGLSIDTRNDVHHDDSDDEADEAAKKVLSPGMADTENIRNKRRQRLARMARNRIELQEADEDEENYHRRNYESTTTKPTSSPIKRPHYMPSPIMEEMQERSFSVSPKKYSRYGSTQKGHDDSPSKRSPQYGPSTSPGKRGHSSGPRRVLSPETRTSPQKASGAFQPFKSPVNVTTSDYARTSYNFDFGDEDDESDVSMGGSSNETRASSKDQDEEREDRYQKSQRYEAVSLDDGYGDDRHGRYQYQDNGDSSTLNAKPSDGSDVVPYSASPKKHHDRREQPKQDRDEDPYQELTQDDSDERIEHRDGYEHRHASAQREERRDEEREDYDSTPHYASNRHEHRHDHYSGRPNVSPSKGRDRLGHHHHEVNDGHQIATYQANAGNDKKAITPAAGRHHPSQIPERRRYAPEPSPRESIQAHMAQAYMSPHGYHNPEYAAMANHNARHALLRRYGAGHNGTMQPPMPQQFGPMSPLMNHQHSSVVQPPTPKHHAPMHPPMPQHYQVRAQTTRNVVMPVVEDDSGRTSGRKSSPVIDTYLNLSMESSFVNASVNTGVGCQAIQCQSVMTKIWTCGTIGDVDDFDPRTRLFEGLAGESMAAFAMGAGGKPQRKAVDSKSDRIAQSDNKTKGIQDGLVGVVDAIEKISAEAQFLGAEATQLFSGVINGTTNATETEKTTKQPVDVKSYGEEDSSCSSDSSGSETEFDIGAPAKKKPKSQEKKGVHSKQKQQKQAQTKPDVSEPRSPTNGIYASVVKGMNRRDQLVKLQKSRQNQNEVTSTKQEPEFVTGTDQLRDVYKQLFDTVKSPMNPLYLDNAKNSSSVVIEELGAKESGMDGETVFHSFDKGTVSGKKEAVAAKEEVAVKEEKEKAAVSGILSALENTLAQMMLPESLSQANVEDSVIGVIGDGDDQDLLFVDEKKEKSTIPATPELEASNALVKSVVESETVKNSEEFPVSQQVKDDLLQKSQEQKAEESQEQKAREIYDVIPAVSMVATMTDADIEAELEKMIDDESVASSGDQKPDNYDGPTDEEIVAELMGDVHGDDGQDNVKSMFDDATVDDDQSALSLPSAMKTKTRFSNEVSQLKIISEDTSDDLESLKRAAEALQEAINRASAAEVQRMNTPSNERFALDKVSESSGEDEQSFATALMDEKQESSPWFRKMWKK